MNELEQFLAAAQKVLEASSTVTVCTEELIRAASKLTEQQRKEAQAALDTLSERVDDDLANTNNLARELGVEWMM